MVYVCVCVCVCVCIIYNIYIKFQFGGKNTYTYVLKYLGAYFWMVGMIVHFFLYIFLNLKNINCLLFTMC